MKTIEEFIAKLVKVDYNSRGATYDKSIKGIIQGTEDVLEVSYDTKMSSFSFGKGDYPLQIVVQVRINGEHAQTWGCTCNEDHIKFSELFIKAQNEAQNKEFESEDKVREHAKTMFDKI